MLWNNFKKKINACRPCASRDLPSSQSGNVFIFVLLGVALFGALMFAFTRSANQGTGNLTKQQAKVAAQEILNYAQLIEGAVDRVRRNGCSESEISFENDIVSGYTNASSPADKSCHIFEDNGGKLIWNAFSENFFDQTWQDGNSNFATPFYVSFFEVANIGRDCSADQCSELTLMLSDLKIEICQEINNLLHINASPSSDGITNYSPYTMSVSKYTGSFNFINIGSILGDNMVALEGKSSGCFLNPPGGFNIPTFYHVLLAR